MRARLLACCLGAIALHLKQRSRTASACNPKIRSRFGSKSYLGHMNADDSARGSTTSRRSSPYLPTVRDELCLQRNTIASHSSSDVTDRLDGLLRSCRRSA
jgi:hypothetical protein